MIVFSSSFWKLLKSAQEQPRKYLLENEGDKPTGQGNFLWEEPLEKEATLENNKIGEVKVVNGPEDGSIQPANDHWPFTTEEKSK